MKVIGAASGIRTNEARVDRSLPLSHRTIGDLALYLIYPLALAVSISVWFIGIHDPLWLDETGSYWQISKGFSGILSRQGDLSFPAYSYILWFSTKIIGTSEIALRIPSILAMLGAVYLLYLAARELFERGAAFVAAIVFCSNFIVIFESIDIRPYAFAVLVTNATIFILLRLRRSDSNWLAALFGFSAACIVWFHFLFIVILPALALCYFAVKVCDRKTLWRQFGVALAVFILAFLPVIPGLVSMFRTSKSHVYEPAPKLLDLAHILAPGWLLPLICFAVLFVLVSVFLSRQRGSQIHFKGWHLLVCASLALIPVLILYGVSVGTSIHLFKASHELVTVPGIALCWALVVSHFNFRGFRLLFCIVLLIAADSQYLGSSYISPRQADSSKYAFEFIQKNASVDNARVLLCSGFTESDDVAMPLDSAKESRYFSQLSYYKLSVPVTPMPKTLNAEAIRVGSWFLQEVSRKHERFLAVGSKPSDGILDWIEQNSAETYYVRKLGVFGGMEVLEFVPRTLANARCN